MNMPRLFPPAYAAYLAFTILVEPEGLARRGCLRLATPQLPPVTVRVQASRGHVLEVLIAGDAWGAEAPLAHFVFDPVGREVTPLRIRLGGRCLTVAPQAEAPEARRQREDAQDALCTFLAFLVVWCYHEEGLTLREAWRDALEDEAGGGG